MPPRKKATSLVASAPVPASTAAGKRKTHPTGDDQPEKKAPKKTSKKHKYPNRKTLREIKYNELVAPPFATEHDPENFPFKVNGKDYSWLVSEKAARYYEQMSEAADNCCADMWDVYIYNDFTGYGEIEFLENVVNAFEKEWKKVRGRKSEELFWRIEALALFLFGNPGQWNMCDDGERVCALRRLISSMFLETFLLLKKDNLLTPDSPLKNIGFVAAVIANCDCANEKLRKVVNLCKDAGITVALGPEGFEYDEGIDIDKFAAQEGDDDDDYDDDDDEDSDEDSEEGHEEESGGFMKALRDYTSITGTSKLGGHEFDLSKWSKAELKRHALGNSSDDELGFATTTEGGYMRGL